MAPLIKIRLENAFLRNPEKIRSYCCECLHEFPILSHIFISLPLLFQIPTLLACLYSSHSVLYLFFSLLPSFPFSFSSPSDDSFLFRFLSSQTLSVYAGCLDINFSYSKFPNHAAVKNNERKRKRRSSDQNVISKWSVRILFPGLFQCSKTRIRTMSFEAPL